jgi:hypothetical protein
MMIDVLRNESMRDEARTDASLRDHLERQRGNQRRMFLLRVRVGNDAIRLKIG